ncbi:hypothetical protein F5X71_19135 [Nocardia brasiliensis]|uniref:Uncharacterized protein n=1 Tax=Nocardia brasiliensis TaxID=37326 RepID=A0A6G9XT81_NOCBR|nr:hypothetical protein [Nocardia brasiliensis]QIS04162.1 hypothetical protein F5X71_19135 [Nocardia brasiliensis]
MSKCQSEAVIALQAAIIGYDTDRTATSLRELRHAVANARAAGVNVAAVLEAAVTVLCTEEELRRIADAA